MNITNKNQWSVWALLIAATILTWVIAPDSEAAETYFNAYVTTASTDCTSDSCGTVDKKPIMIVLGAQNNWIGGEFITSTTKMASGGALFIHNRLSLLGGIDLAVGVIGIEQTVTVHSPGWRDRSDRGFGTGTFLKVSRGSLSLRLVTYDTSYSTVMYKPEEYTDPVTGSHILHRQTINTSYTTSEVWLGFQHYF